MWFIFALLSAVFAAVTSILVKIGIEEVNPTFATAVRTCVVVIMAWIMVFITHTQNVVTQISKQSLLFLILSGISTGVSWLCYYKALQIGSVSRVVSVDKFSIVINLILASIFLHESFTVQKVLGAVLIIAGILLVTL